MKYFILGIIIVVCLIADPASGCHRKRKKRSVPAYDAYAPVITVKKFMPNCIKNQLAKNPSYSTRNWDGPVSYTLFHSTWYQSVDTIECSSYDTVDCWIRNLPNYISESPVLVAVQKCVKKYYDDFHSIQTPDIPEKYLPRGITVINNASCSTVNRTALKYDVVSQVDRNFLDIDDDSIVDFDDVIDFVKDDMICPSCDCSSLQESDDDENEYDFSDGKSCGSCWTSRLATATRKTSKLRRPADRQAIRRLKMRRRKRNRINQKTQQLQPRPRFVRRHQGGRFDRRMR